MAPRLLLLPIIIIIFFAFSFVLPPSVIATKSSSSSSSSPPLNPPLRFHFYHKSCPPLHSIVSERVAYYTSQDPTTPAPLLRLFFHDCFVQGCDASALLNATSSAGSAEKDSDINFSLAGFDVIDDIKSLLETHCPGVVSCADIIALTAVYSVQQAGGPLYDIQLGRRDALTSYAASALTFLPAATLDVDGLLENFAVVGLDQVDVVTLSGAHTIGQGHCRSIANRIYPTIDTAYHAGYGAALLYNCTDGGSLTAPDFDPEVQFFNDAITSLKFDNGYFKGLQQGYGLFSSDNVLFTDPRTRPLVDLYTRNQSEFFRQFGVSLRKMGKIGVLTGTQGEIRDKCWVRNSDNADPALDPQ